MLTTQRRIGRRFVLPGLLGLLAVALIAPAPTFAGVGPLTTFRFEMNDWCASGEGPAWTEIKLTLRGPDGGFQGSGLRTTDGDGEWEFCGFWDDINAGDTLTAKVGSSTRSFVVPPLNFSINRASDVVSGKTAANSEVLISVVECQAAVSCSNVTDRVRPTNGKGKFSTDFTSAYDLRGHDRVTINWHGPQGDNIVRRLNVPSMEVYTLYNEVGGTANPNKDVTVWLFNKMGTQVAKARDHSNWWSGFYGVEFNRDILPGMFVGSDIASDALWKVFDFNPQFDTANDIISAKCWKNKPWYLNGRKLDDSDLFSREGVTDSNGNFSIDTASFFDLAAEDLIHIRCRNPLGDDQESLFEVH